MADEHGDDHRERDGEDQQHEVHADRAQLEPLAADREDHGSTACVRYSCSDAVAVEERVLQRLGAHRQLVQDELVARRQLADRLDGHLVDLGRVRGRTGLGEPPRLAAGGTDGRHELIDLRAPHVHPLRRVAIDEVVDRALLDQPAAADHDEILGHQRHLRQEVAADEHGLSQLREVDEDVADPADALRIEPVGRLVEDHRVWIAEHHAGQTEPLAHPERVPLDPPLGDVGQTDELQDLLDAPPRDPVRRGEPSQVVARRPAGVHVAGVEQAADLVQGLGERAVLLAVERRRTSLVPVEPEHASHRRALARPVRPEEPGDPAGHDVEAQVIDGDDLAEPLGQTSHLDHGAVSDHAQPRETTDPNRTVCFR